MFSGTYLSRPNKRVPLVNPQASELFKTGLILILCFEQGSDIIFLDPLLDVAHISHCFHCFWNKQLTAQGTSERIFCLIEVQFLTLHLIYIYFFPVQWECTRYLRKNFLFDRSSVSHFTSYLYIFLSCSVRMKNLVLWQPPGLTKSSWCWLAIELQKLDTFLGKL